jgi:hypothetical protein
VSNRRDHRYGTGHDRARDHLLVEGPQVFQGAAPTPDDDHIHIADLADGPEPTRNIECCTLTLDARRTNHDMHVRVPPPQHVDDVTNGGAVERGHYTDLARQDRKRALSALIEQSFGPESLPELVEGKLESAETGRLQMLANKLILALRVVNCQAPTGDHTKTVARLEAQIPERRPKHNASDLGRRVLQGEIEMSGVPVPGVRDLSFDPHFEEPLLEQCSNVLGQLGHGQNPAPYRRRRRL